MVQQYVNPITQLPVWSLDAGGNVIQTGNVTSGDGYLLTATASPPVPSSGLLKFFSPDGVTLATLDASGRQVTLTTSTGQQSFTSGTGPVVTTTGTANGEVLYDAVGADATSVALAASVTGDAFDRFRALVTGLLSWGTGSGARDTSFGRLAAAIVGSTDSSIAVDLAGKGFQVKEGANAKQGTSTLAAGTVVVANTSVTANSRIFVTSQADGGTPGFLRVQTRTPGTSFTITSSSGTDTSTVAWEIFEPAP